MNGQSDTSHSARLSTQVAVESSYGSTSTSDRTSLSDLSTDEGRLTSPVGERADGSSRNTPADVSHQLQSPASSSTNRTDDVEDRAEVLKRRDLLCFSLVDVALIVAGTYVLVRHWRDGASVCHSDEVKNHGSAGDVDEEDVLEFKFSERWRLWALVAILSKTVITGARVGRWCLESRRENSQASERGLQILNWLYGIWCLIGINWDVYLDPESCDRDMDEPIFQLCLVILIMDLIAVGINVVRGQVVEIITKVAPKVVLLGFTIFFLLLLLGNLLVGLLHRPRALVYLCLWLVVMCLSMLSLLGQRLLQRMREQQDQTDRLPVTC